MLTANDVHSVLLTTQEQLELELKYFKKKSHYASTEYIPKLEANLQAKDKEYDRLAQEAGFSQFDENDEGTGVRNYTALKKRKTPEIKEQLSLFDKLLAESPIMKELNKESKELFAENQRVYNQFTQEHLRECLAIANPRINRTDVNGEIILSPENFLEKYKALSSDERFVFTSSIQATITAKKRDDDATTQINVDKNIAPFLQKILDAGYATGQSCSGTVTDHPNYRFVSGPNIGECIHHNKRGCNAYLTFWKPEAEMLSEMEFAINDEQQIQAIEKVADETGWIVEYSDIFFMPSVVLRLPYTYDGAPRADIIKEANNIINEKYPELYQKSFFQWLDYRDAALYDVEQQHGGVVRWTDEMITKKWNDLAVGLEREQKLHVTQVTNSDRRKPVTFDNTLKQNKFVGDARELKMSEEEREKRDTLKRIDNVRIYTAKNGTHFIKCSIDGMQQSAKPIKNRDVEYINGDKIKEKNFAIIYFNDELKGMQSEQHRTMKR